MKTVLDVGQNKALKTSKKRCKASAKLRKSS